YRNNVNDIICKRLKKKIQELAEKKKIEVLFRSQMCFMIQDIEKAALLSEYVNLLITEMEPEAADQKMQDFEMQKPFSEKTVKRDFKMIIISDKKEKKKKKKKKKKNEK
ncbi:hypothetical protein BDDG_13566, partial [Blastomyces dermatitidis ATCC 18188]